MRQASVYSRKLRQRVIPTFVIFDFSAVAIVHFRFGNSDGRCLILPGSWKFYQSANHSFWLECITSWVANFWPSTSQYRFDRNHLILSRAIPDLAKSSAENVYPNHLRTISAFSHLVFGWCRAPAMLMRICNSWFPTIRLYSKSVESAEGWRAIEVTWVSQLKHRCTCSTARVFCDIFKAEIVVEGVDKGIEFHWFVYYQI